MAAFAKKGGDLRRVEYGVATYAKQGGFFRRVENGVATYAKQAASAAPRGCGGGRLLLAVVRLLRALLLSNLLMVRSFANETPFAPLVSGYPCIVANLAIRIVVN